MLSIFSLIYGPLIVLMMNHLEPAVSSWTILIISVVLILLHFREKSPVWIIPFVYLVISIGTLIFGKTMWLKLGPLAISLGVAILLSMKERTPQLIQDSINKWKFLRDKNFSKEQIRSNTWIWTAAAWFNVLLHIIFLLSFKNWAWAFYVSIGWYGVFALAAAIHLYIWQRRKRK